MCGIAGLWRFDRGATERETVIRMLGAMRHRGPEGAATARLDEGALHLGFLALGFTDHPGSLQPLYNEDYTVAIAYNGEVYDHEAMREVLEVQGHRFRTRSDTEVLIHLYEQLGDSFVHRLNGEFAFALWDARTETLRLVRDRYGVKPLFYSVAGGTLRFASEAKALLAVGDCATSLDPAWFLGPGSGLPATAVTPFVGIRQVRPGHTLEVGREGVLREHAWWTPAMERRAVRDGELRDVVERAVRRRVSGDVPIALALSSGLDSAIVASIAAHVRPGLTALTLSYPDAAYDEAGPAAKTAAALGLNHTPVEVTAEALADGFLRSIWSTETATNNLSTTARLLLTTAARRAGFKALTGGEAADEVFGGYPYFGVEAAWRACASPEPALRARGERALARFRSAESLSRGTFWDEATGGGANGHPFGFQSVVHGRALRAQKTAAWLWSPALSASVSATLEASLLSELDAPHLRSLDPFDATRMMSRSIFASFVPPALGDRVEMAASLEGRVPFLDAEVLDVGWRLGEADCIDLDTGQRKVALRRAFAGRLPPIAPPPKHTWMAPDFWALSRLPVGAELFAQYLSVGSARRVGVFEPRAVAALSWAWKACPRWSGSWRALDGAVGFVVSVHALHDIFVERTVRFDTPEALSCADRSPPAPRGVGHA